MGGKSTPIGEEREWFVSLTTRDPSPENFRNMLTKIAALYEILLAIYIRCQAISLFSSDIHYP